MLQTSFVPRNSTNNPQNDTDISEHLNIDQVQGVLSNNIEPTNEIATETIDGSRSRLSKKY